MDKYASSPFLKGGSRHLFLFTWIVGQCDCVLLHCVLPSGLPSPFGQSRSLLGNPRVALLGTSLAYGHRLIRTGQILLMCLNLHLSRILPSTASLPSRIDLV